VAVAVRADVARDHLLIGAGDVPAELDGSQAVLGFGEIAGHGADLQGQTDGAGVAFGIDRGLVESARPTDAEHHLICLKETEAEGFFVQFAFIQTDHSDRPSVLNDEADDVVLIKDRNGSRLDLFQQTLHHLMGGPGSCRGGALAGIMIGLVSHITAETVMREWHADLRQVKELLRRHGGFDERQLSVHGAAVKQRACHVVGRIRLFAGQGQLVISLFVGSGVVGGAAADFFRDQSDVVMAVLMQMHGAVERCGAAADDDRVNLMDGKG